MSRYRAAALHDGQSDIARPQGVVARRLMEWLLPGQYLAPCHAGSPQPFPFSRLLVADPVRMSYRYVVTTKKSLNVAGWCAVPFLILIEESARQLQLSSREALVQNAA